MFKFFSVIFLLSALPVYETQATSTHFDISIVKSPNVHKYVGFHALQTTLDDLFVTLKSHNYDLSKFSVTVTLSDEEATIQGLMNRFSHGSYDRYTSYFDNPNSSPDKFMKNNAPAFRESLLNFQLCEATGVFYRDLKTILDNRHRELMGDPDYEKHRQSNFLLVKDLFDEAERVEFFLKGTLNQSNLLKGVSKKKRPFLTFDKIQKILKKHRVFPPSTGKASGESSRGEAS